MRDWTDEDDERAYGVFRRYALAVGVDQVYEDFASIEDICPWSRVDLDAWRGRFEDEEVGL